MTLSLASVLAVASGGAIGTLCRFAIVRLSLDLWGYRFPYGTLIVNSIGSFLAGFLMVLILHRFVGNDNWRLFLMVGCLGGFTTFSSFSWETWFLFESGQQLVACFNIILNNFFALGLAFVGMIIGRWILN